MKKFKLGNSHYTVSLDKDGKNLLVTNGSNQHVFNFTKAPLGITVQGNELHIVDALDDTARDVRFKVDNKMSVSIESFPFPGSGGEHALVVGIDDMRTGRTISAVSLDGHVVNLYRRSGFLVVSKAP